MGFPIVKRRVINYESYFRVPIALRPVDEVMALQRKIQ
jgi:hypothetical protein